VAHERAAESDRTRRAAERPSVKPAAGVEPAALEREGPAVLDALLLQRLQATAGNTAVTELLRAERLRRGGAVVARAAPAAPAGAAPETETETAEDEQEVPDAADQAHLAAAPPAPPPPPAEPEPHPAVTVQRDTDDDGGGGLLGGIRRRISQVVGGLRSGWDQLSGAASSAFAGITSRVSAGARALADLGSSVTSGLRTAFTNASRTVTQLADGLMNGLKRGVGGLAGAASDIGPALASMDVAAIRAAWGRLQGMVGAVSASFSQARAAMTARFGALWTSLQTGFSSALDGARARAQALGDGLRAAATAVQQRLASLWAGMQQRAGQLTGVAGGVARFLMAIVERLLSAARSLWQSVQKGWNALERRASGLVDQVTKQLGDLWEGLKRRSAGLWDTLRGAWSRAVDAASRAANRVAGGVVAMWHQIQGFSLTSMLDKLSQYVSFIGSVKQAAHDPKGLMAPYATKISGELQAAMPAKARDVASEHLQSVGGPATASAGSAPLVQRQPDTATAGDGRSTLTFGKALSLIWGAIKEKWAKLNVGETVLAALWTIVWPWPTVWNELKGMGADWRAAAGSLFKPQGISHPLEFLHDLWSDLLRLLDFPLVLWRHLNNIGLALWGWVTVALVILGAVGGSVAGTVIGAIAGFLGGLGIGAAPGAGLGAAGGGLAGAGAGFGVALGLGEAMVISFAAAEGTNLVKVILALWTARETPEEQARDASSAADSSLALAITLVLVLLGWIGARIAAAAAPIFRALVPAWLSDAAAEFMRGVKGGQPPPETRPPPEPAPPPEAHPAEVPPAGMSADLQAIRAGLRDPRAIEQFDNMFNRMHGDSARMQGVIDGMRARGDLEQRLIDDWTRQNPAPGVPFGEAIDQVAPLKDRATALRDQVNDYLDANPQIGGRGWTRALNGEIARLDDMLAGRLEATAQDVTSTSSNIDGVEAEFNSAKGATNVTGVGRKFSLDGRQEAVEVDVVSDGGRRWTDVKRVEPFGLDSTNWTGHAGHQGLETQATEMLRSASQNPVDGAPPTVVFEFPRGVTREVANALRDMGAEVDGMVVDRRPVVPVPQHQKDDNQDGG
jgi:hypothetical protein